MDFMSGYHIWLRGYFLLAEAFLVHWSFLAVSLTVYLRCLETVAGVSSGGSGRHKR